MVSFVIAGKINCEPLQKKSERITLPSYVCPLQVTGTEQAISEARTRKVVRGAGPRRGRSTGSALNPSASCGGRGLLGGVSSQGLRVWEEWVPRVCVFHSSGLIRCMWLVSWAGVCGLSAACYKRFCTMPTPLQSWGYPDFTVHLP